MKRARMNRSTGVLAVSWNRLKVSGDSIREALARHDIEHELLARQKVRK